MEYRQHTADLQVLFLQGGASTAFANVPLNLSKAGDSVDHIVTGSWSKKAAEEARKYCKVNVAAKGDNKHIPEQKSWKLQKQAKYVHYCDNETIQVYLQLRLARWHQLYCQAPCFMSTTFRWPACGILSLVAYNLKSESHTASASPTGC